MNSKQLGLCAVLAVSILVPLTAFSCNTADVTANEMTILAGPPGQNNTAGYAQFHNSGKENCVLVGATTPVAKRVELHTVTEKNGMMKMQQVHEFIIPAHGDLSLTSGGNHLMFIDLKQALVIGDQVPITLEFKGGEVATMNATVVDMRKNAPAAHSNH